MPSVRSTRASAGGGRRHQFERRHGTSHDVLQVLAIALASGAVVKRQQEVTEVPGIDGDGHGASDRGASNRTVTICHGSRWTDPLNGWRGAPSSPTTTPFP